MNESRKANKILLKYDRPNMTAKEIFKSIPKRILLKLIKFLTVAKSKGGKGYDYNMQVLMLERAEQTLVGKWIQ